MSSFLKSNGMSDGSPRGVGDTLAVGPEGLRPSATELLAGSEGLRPSATELLTRVAQTTVPRLSVWACPQEVTETFA
jgi:hypothetical protein